MALRFKPSGGADSITNQISNHSDGDGSKITSFSLYLIRVVKRHGDVALWHE